MRSPSSAPCVNGLDGSTDTTPTSRPSARTLPDERRDEARLADAGRPGEPDRVRAAGRRVHVADHLVGERVAVLDERDRARERAPVAGAQRVDETLPRPFAAGGHRSGGRLAR